MRSIVGRSWMKCVGRFIQISGHPVVMALRVMSIITFFGDLRGYF